MCPNIKFSIDGASKRTYEKIRHKGKWDDLIKNLELSNKYLKKYNLKIYRLSVNEKTKSFKEVMNNYKIIIHCYLGTPFFESMYYNKPCIVILKKQILRFSLKW